MKILLATLTILLSLNASATHYLTYYVYFETEYIQGPWSRTKILDESEYKYLTVEMYDDLFGTVDSQLAEKIISRLKDKKPEVYNWKYELTIQGDTVVITSKSKIENLKTIKNELIASLIFNNFKAVAFIFNGKSVTLNLTDLTVPYFDLISKQPEITVQVDTVFVQEQALPIESVDLPKAKRNPFKIWFIISLLLNLGLFGTLILQKTKNSHNS